jgi:tripartite-type tricarboxylate transporter receptor subunit TctC
VPAKNLQELLALAKAQPGKLSFASPGVGATPHMAGELLKATTGIDIFHVPYKGTTPAIADLMGGQVTMMFSQMSSALPLARQGKVRAIGVASLQRHPAAPEIPTIAEQGLPGFEVQAWYALVGPAALPPEIANKVAADATKALQMPDVKERLAALGADPVGGTPRELDQKLRAEYARWGELIRKAGIKIAE